MTSPNLRTWRAQGDDQGIDEVCAGGWFHLECLGVRHYYVGIGDVQLWVRLDRKGKVASIYGENAGEPFRLEPRERKARRTRG